MVIALTQVLKQNQHPFDSDTQKFIDQLKKKSTQQTYSVGLGEFHNFLDLEKKLTISQWIDLVDDDRFKPHREASNIATDTLKDFVIYMGKKEKAFSPNTINLYVASVQSLVKFCFRGSYKITTAFAGLPKPDSQSDKEEWNLNLIKAFLLSMDKPVYRALVAVIFQSGLGLEETLSLKYKDLQEELEQGIKPICLKLKRRKTSVHFQTFLGSDAVNQLLEYFKAEGTPQPDQPIFHRSPDPQDPGCEMKPLSKGGIERYFARRARRFIKIPWFGENPRRPHSLRAAFQKLLTLAGCAEIFPEFWMGHEVTRNKSAYIIKGMGREEMRSQYRKFEYALRFSTEEPKSIEGVKND